MLEALAELGTRARLALGAGAGAFAGYHVARPEDRGAGLVVGALAGLLLASVTPGLGTGEGSSDRPSWRRFPCDDPRWWEDIPDAEALEALVLEERLTLEELDCVVAADNAAPWQRVGDLELESAWP